MRVARAMATVMRVAGDEVAMTTAARAMEMATMVAGKSKRWHGNEEGDGDGDKGG